MLWSAAPAVASTASTHLVAPRWRFPCLADDDCVVDDGGDDDDDDDPLPWLDIFSRRLVALRLKRPCFAPGSPPGYGDVLSEGCRIPR